MNQIKRRPNPFDTKEPTPQPQEQSYNKPNIQYETQTRVPEPRKVVQAPVVNTDVREKYTSTMDQALRKKIKIACAMKGIMFAQFIEEACMDKLTKEGMM